MSWIQAIGDLRFDVADRDVFTHENPATRVLALQRYFFPQLGRLLKGTTSLIRGIYGEDSLEGLTRAERPRPKGGGYAVTEFENVQLGLTGVRHPEGLKFKKPEGVPLQYGISKLVFDVHRLGTIRVVFLPMVYGLDATAQKRVCGFFKSTLGHLETIASSHFVTNNAAIGGGLLEDFAREPTAMFTAGAYFPIDAKTGLLRLAVTFAAMLPWLRGMTDLSLGLKTRVDRDVKRYIEWWEREGPPILFPEMVEAADPPASPASESLESRLKSVTDAPVLRDRQRWRVLERDDWRCVACGKSAHDDVQLEIDHKVPRSRGGSDDDDNLQVLCRTCNSGKSNSGSGDLTKAARGSD